jgi:ribose 5-phosphate isomerase A
MANDRETAWAAAGGACAQLIEDGMRVGLGTGRAATAGIRALGQRVRSEGLTIVGVPTSDASAAVATEEGIPLGAPGPALDIAFDGADAIDPAGLCVKGAGGAMVRERVLAEGAGRFIVLVDEPKIVPTLDEWGILPLAVVPFAADAVSRSLADLSPTRRPVDSDDGMALIDLALPAGSDWPAVASRARALPGVLDHGLFRLVLADVFIGRTDGSVTTAA